MGNVVAYHQESKDIKKRLKVVNQKLASKTQLEKAIEAERNDSDWRKKGQMSIKHFTMLQRLEQLKPQIPALEKEKKNLESTLKVIKMKHIGTL
jgi:hypothetical protein